MNSDGWEILFDEKLGQGHTTLHGLDEDHDLVELQCVGEVVQPPVLHLLIDPCVLRQSVEHKLRLLVHADLVRVLHELLAEGPGLEGDRRAEIIT